MVSWEMHDLLLKSALRRPLPFLFLLRLVSPGGSPPLVMHSFILRPRYSLLRLSRPCHQNFVSSDYRRGLMLFLADERLGYSQGTTSIQYPYLSHQGSTSIPPFLALLPCFGPTIGTSSRMTTELLACRRMVSHGLALKAGWADTTGIRIFSSALRSSALLAPHPF